MRETTRYVAPGKTAPAAPLDKDKLESVAAADIRADDLIGATIYGANDEDIGEVVELTLGEDGATVNGAVIDVGGFLGKGGEVRRTERKWKSLSKQEREAFLSHAHENHEKNDYTKEHMREARKEIVKKNQEVADQLSKILEAAFQRALHGRRNVGIRARGGIIHQHVPIICTVQRAARPFDKAQGRFHREAADQRPHEGRQQRHGLDRAPDVAVRDHARPFSRSITTRLAAPNARAAARRRRRGRCAAARLAALRARRSRSTYRRGLRRRRPSAPASLGPGGARALSPSSRPHVH